MAFTDCLGGSLRTVTLHVSGRCGLVLKLSCDRPGKILLARGTDQTGGCHQFH
jgi:hypothetical protein